MSGAPESQLEYLADFSAREARRDIRDAVIMGGLFATVGFAAKEIINSVPHFSYADALAETAQNVGTLIGSTVFVAGAISAARELKASRRFRSAAEEATEHHL